MASASALFGMADFRRTVFRPCPNGRLHVDLRTERGSIVRAGSELHISTLSCNIMAGLSRVDYDAPDCAQKLPAKKVLRADHPGYRCIAEGCTMGDGHGIGQSPPFRVASYSDGVNRCVEDFWPR